MNSFSNRSSRYTYPSTKLRKYQQSYSYRVQCQIKVFIIRYLHVHNKKKTIIIHINITFKSSLILYVFSNILTELHIFNRYMCLIGFTNQKISFKYSIIQV